MNGEELIRKWRQLALLQVHVNLPTHLGLSSERVAEYRTRMPGYIIGADEVGRGPLAGPVTVCAFMAPADWHMEGLKDSKKHTPHEREELQKKLVNEGLGHHIAELSNLDIDRWGMVQCLQLLFEECLEQLRFRFPEQFEDSLVVLDGKERARNIDHISLPKGDDLVQHVSAASVLAKCHRDSWMKTVADSMYPQYMFSNHKGYGTPGHRKVLKRIGPCPLHRITFLDNVNAWRN